MIGPSLRGLHWLEGRRARARAHFCIKKAYIFGLRGGATAPLALPLYPPLGKDDELVYPLLEDIANGDELVYDH